MKEEFIRLLLIKTVNMKKSPFNALNNNLEFCSIKRIANYGKNQTTCDS
jgi:hypothetical protein